MSSGFDSLPLSRELIQVTRELRYERMTPIQAKAIPALLEGRDLVGQSRTGSGKTAAFSIPMLMKITLRRRSVQALVLCPTRELCAQVAREVRRLGRHYPGLNVLILSGGQPIGPQIRSLEKGAHIVVGTPGRLLDHLERGTLGLDGVSTLVLDEADRMLDMGFEEDMAKIFGALPAKRQTALFSATFPRSIEAMIDAIQHDPVRVVIEDGDGGASRASISDVLVDCAKEDKREALLALLRRLRPGSAMVFCNLKATVSELARSLASEGLSAAALHGDLEQRDRDRVMAKFRNQSTRVLVATDVAARGIDVEGLDLVVNFDLSPDPEVYVHRVGRTGRAGKSGLAYSLVTSQDASKIQRIEELVGRSIPRETLEPAEPLTPESAATEDQAAKMATLFIGGGRKDKMRPGDILGALTGDAGFPASDIGKIEIHDRFSYVAVSREIAREAIRRLTAGKIKGRKFRVGMAR